ncbi:RagB/SusD family nutrient uptake outer membrane protein [Dysgonomonas massiliensis]|uniref:RagB/SusD family nutrient uptake outer membrane protein n=1 Tax=Dysgonomonas massiliensis TaxID=2040292 RepID=UPI000C77F3D1|nr:RagB/SusD family nutrient uptake outer membrane protein [Dysgonomonas massiliensis]
MKKIILLLIIGTCIFSSCGDSWLDKSTPSTSDESSKVITSAREAQYALNGIYFIMRKYEYYGARYTYYGDVTGEDMQANGDTKRASNYYLFNFNKENAPASFWEYPYQVIRNANNVLEFLESIADSDMTEELLDIKGQALALRAMGHFDLVKVFGAPFTKDNGASLGVPIELKKKDPKHKPARNTVAEVYKQVITDLSDAIELLSAAQNNGQINKFAAQQLLARAYLYTDDNKNAYTTITNMIEEAEKPASKTKGQYTLWTNEEYSTVWSKDFTKEILFGLAVHSDEIKDSKEFIGYLMWRSGYDDIILTYDYVDLLSADPDDVRLEVVTKYVKDKGKPKEKILYYLNKYPGNADAQENPTYADIPVLRLSEAYLIAAEAAVKLNDNTNAVKYLNAIVSRANPEKSVTGTVTLDQVLTERRKELVGEGHRLFDAMRNNKRIERKGASHTSPLLTDESRSFDRSYFKTLMSIPKREMDLNKNMINNPGY